MMMTHDLSINIVRTFTIISIGYIGEVMMIDCPDTWTAFHGSCYLFEHQNPLPFFEAENYCHLHGGHLVHIDNAVENAFLKDFAHALSRTYWIDATDETVEGLWEWFDTKTPLTYSNWNPGQPNDNGDNEDCALIDGAASYNWNDAPCSYKAEPLCEKTKADQEVVG